MKYSVLLFLVLLTTVTHAENGYELWLRYKPLPSSLQANYRTTIRSINIQGTGQTIDIIRKELGDALAGLLSSKVPFSSTGSDGSVVVKTQAVILDHSLQNNEGYRIITSKEKGKRITLITANSEIGLLYGTFHFIRLLQTGQSIVNLNIISASRIKLRMLNHWDNLDRTVERGYAGLSLWNWHTLPEIIDQRYHDYARANASVGINATVLTNVNANAIILTQSYLEKVAALANVFRPYGIKVFLTARFSAPVEIGGLKTADPIDPAVIRWWKGKCDSIYKLIPDFGGFLVKANSEGQPGPQNYNRTHADGANMLATAVAPHKGMIIWRAFVYTNENPDDRHKQAYSEFKPLDGSFKSNVVVQVKNGAIDFMPREPFHPLFGAMPSTRLAMEFQITQEYLGQATHLAYLAPLYKETLLSNTWANGKETLVSKIIEGDPNDISVMAGVANTGNDINWTGHPFAQANWYAFGRLSWDNSLSSEAIADEWLRMTFSNDNRFVDPVKQLMLTSREVVVRYMNPIGLHHLMGTGHHYGPAPWVSNLSRADWNPVYYHKGDSAGIGFNRTITGSAAVDQYAPEVKKIFNDINSIPLRYLLWFHHVPWQHRLANNRNVWEELCYQYNLGVNGVRQMIKTWSGMEGYIDSERFTQVEMLLARQEKEAVWWRDACLSYFSRISKLPIPSALEQPAHSLEYYQSLRFPYAPGN